MALYLAKYRRPFSVALALCLIWLMAALPMLLTALAAVGINSPTVSYLAKLPPHFGFDFIAAFSWTAYLLTAPRVRELYFRTRSSAAMSMSPEEAASDS